MATVVDRFAVFEDTCRAAGIESGSKRLEIFLALPDWVQEEVFADLAARVHLASPDNQAQPVELDSVA